MWILLATVGVVHAGRPVGPTPAANAGDIPVLADLLSRAGWQPTPELSGVYRPGSVFRDDGAGSSLMVRACFEVEVGRDTYTAAEVVTQLQAGVRVRLGLGSVSGDGELVKKVKFSVPVHETIERLAMVPSPTCRDLLSRAAPEDLAKMYAVQEVLTAEIAEQTCGRVDAEGRFVGLGAAEAELAMACQQESLEPVAVAYRIVPLAELGFGPAETGRAISTTPDCPWGPIRSVSTTMTSLSVNGQVMSVRGTEARMATTELLQRCGLPEAAESFEAWRENRRWTNGMCATLIGCYWAFIPATRAAEHREELEQILLTGMTFEEQRIAEKQARKQRR